MAFNNPSSTKPVSYASATKSLGYLARAVANACSRDNDDDENAHLLRKKKSNQENRAMVASLCVCLCCLVTIVLLFVIALLNLTYPHPVPQGVHSIGAILGKGVPKGLAKMGEGPRPGSTGMVNAGIRGRDAHRRTSAKANQANLAGRHTK